jgi:ABC-type antimicrobial peptide transport system permease subunit
MGNDLSIQEVRTLEDVVAGAVATERVTLQVIGLFAAIALTLALIGVYSVTAYAVNQRNREIGIRLAVGAEPRHILQLVLAQAAKPIALGLVLGAVASVPLSSALSSLLYQLRPTDPLPFALVPLFLAAGAFSAAFLPARKALRQDPMAVLRNE